MDVEELEAIAHEIYLDARPELEEEVERVQDAVKALAKEEQNPDRVQEARRAVKYLRGAYDEEGIEPLRAVDELEEGLKGF